MTGSPGEAMTGAPMSAFDQAVKTVRFLSADAVEKAKSGHPGTPMALAGIAVDLYSRYLRYVPDQPDWPNRDRFVLSCGHASMLLYSVLHLAGYPLTIEELQGFRQWGSRTPGHPEAGHTPGVETTTGPLGQGIGNAVGMALGSKLLGARLNRPGSTLIDYRVFVLASDGDLMEGVASEASSLAGHLGLDNLIVVYDDNRITIDGTTDLTFSEDVGKRYEAYGWSVQRVDGHDPEQVRRALDRATGTTGSPGEPGRPSLIIARTHIAIGAPTKQDSPAAHGAPLGQKEIDAAKEAAQWPLTPFYAPPEAYQPFQEHVARNRALQTAWQRALEQADAERRTLLRDLGSRPSASELLQRLIDTLPSKDDATRSLSATIQQQVAKWVPALVQGSADLAASCKTTIKGAPDVSRGEFSGRNLHFGIREHGMGAIMNGLASPGAFLPIGSTFLMFSDYMRPSIRMAALMGKQVIYVFTHDSIFVGEDGPTHQPIEQVAALRLIPNLHVFRPADALECAAAWSYAVGRKDGPTALVLTRQTLPALKRPQGFVPEDVLRGGYVVSDAKDPNLVLIATGSEVHVAVEAKEIIAKRGLRVRVVSAPCWEAFASQPAGRRAEVLGEGIRRVAIEAGSTQFWAGVVGLDGVIIGIDRFGASAPAERLATEFGLTPPQVAERILAQVI